MDLFSSGLVVFWVSIPVRKHLIMMRRLLEISSFYHRLLNEKDKVNSEILSIADREDECKHDVQCFPLLLFVLIKMPFLHSLHRFPPCFKISVSFPQRCCILSRRGHIWFFWVFFSGREDRELNDGCCLEF